MMVRSTTSLIAATALAALLTGASVASAQEPDADCGAATAVVANVQVTLDAKEAELVNLRAALDLALGGDDEAAIADAEAAVDAAVGAVADLEADLDVAIGERDEACTPTPGPSTTPTTPSVPSTAPDAGNDVDDLTGGGFGQTEPDDVPVGAADTGGL